MGLFRTAAKVGVATSVHGRVRQRQHGQWAQPSQAAPAPAAPQAAPPAPATPVAAPDMIEQLRQLGELRDSGTLTPAEFDIQKARLLAL